MSGHSAIFVHLLCPSLNTSKLSGNEEIKRSRMAWHKASNGDLQKYKIHLNETLNAIDLANDIHDCKYLMCCTDDHVTYNGRYCDEIIKDVHDESACISHTDTVSPKRRKPGWNEYVNDVNQEAMFWRNTWILNG